MAYSRDTTTDEQGGVQIVRVSRTSNRSDLFPMLIGMQKEMGARNFAVFRAAISSFPNKRKLVCELENWGMGAAEQTNALVSALGTTLLEHIDGSLLPLIWSTAQGKGISITPEMVPMLKQADNTDLPYAGVALPIKLGNIGNGLVVFCGTALELDCGTTIDHHLKCCQVMIDLLALDERRSTPTEALSEREIACLQLAGDGKISEEIAVKLGLSVHTVNAYLGSATIKLDSVNRIQAIAKAIRMGYIH